MLRYYELIKALAFGLFFTAGFCYGSVSQAIKGHWGNAVMILGLAVLFGGLTFLYWRRWRIRNPTPPPDP